LASTLIAVLLLPVAFLFTHAFITGRNRGSGHSKAGLVALISDLVMSLGYMINRYLTAGSGGGSLHLSGWILNLFIIHGIVSAIVILLELGVLATGVLTWRGRIRGPWHRRLTYVLFPLWWFSFLSGEVGYLLLYVL
jgi:uncharacterized membrane protein YozB (DUF420 family)